MILDDFINLARRFKVASMDEKYFFHFFFMFFIFFSSRENPILIFLRPSMLALVSAI